MKVNFKKTKPVAPFFSKLINEWCFNFATEYDISIPEAHNYLLHDPAGQIKFSEYLKEHKVLNLLPYELTKSDGHQLANGFDIVEDELYTIALIKYTEEK